jgi:hypothetical protein
LNDAYLSGPVQLTLDSYLDIHLADEARRRGRGAPAERCPGCAARNPATDPPCAVCGRDYDPATGSGIVF